MAGNCLVISYNFHIILTWNKLTDHIIGDRDVSTILEICWWVRRFFGLRGGDRISGFQNLLGVSSDRLICYGYINILLMGLIVTQFKFSYRQMYQITVAK